MKLLIFTLFILGSLYLSSLVNAQSIEIESSGTNSFAVATWVEKSEDEFRIFESACYQLVGPKKIPKWTAPTIIHRSRAPITSTSLVTLNNGRQTLFWSEQNRSKTQINYKDRQNALQEWSNAMTLHDKGTENIGVNLFRTDNKIWAFWATTDMEVSQSALPDIVYKIFEGGIWSGLNPLHKANSVPDIQPISSLNDEGNLVVEWLSYSFLQSSYIRAQKIFSNNFDIGELIDIIDVEGFETPDFLPSGQAITLRFPLNQFDQSRVVATDIQSIFHD